MNKYQEALDELEKMKQNHLQLTKEKYSHEPLKSDMVARRETHYKKVEIALQELVDRATPKKVFGLENLGYNGKLGFCENCKTGIVQPLYEHIHHCPLCGQALDWGDEK